MRIENIEQLNGMSRGKTQLDCYVLLNGGLRSSKTLMFEEDGGVNVINEIDDTSEGFDSLEEMAKGHSTIKEALEKGAFYVFDYEEVGSGDYAKNMNIEVGAHDFEHTFGRMPKFEEFERFSGLCRKGVQAQVDWDIIFKETRDVMDREAKEK